ncbi:hypothetical protein [Granulicella arctica]|uniref:Drug/metabolite transporter (DMT)-like permease n=1 Tax=Granulicella arctica TaxID=940613 RepID=A0A7Y9PJ98_9BACT|nr:hypothetical protein [Granulicella arctica]NYF80166.1 drug/metabolite transporter (DMT)-like permease [Granulicella arctica]
MRRLQGFGFALFCLLAGSRWLVENAFPSALPPLEQGSLQYAVVGVVAVAIWIFRSRSTDAKFLPWPLLAVASLLLLGLPVLLNVSSGTGVALFALVPLCVVVGVVACGREARGRALMMPALIGLAGALLLLPFQLPSTAYGGFMFGVVFVAVLLAAGGSIWMHALLQGRNIAQAVAVICGANAVLLGVAALLRGEGMIAASSSPAELLRCLVLDLPQMFLLVWLLREMPPERLAARFLVAPLLTAIEGVILLHPPLDIRMGLGMMLMLLGSGALLFWNGADESASASSLGLN